MEKIRYLIRIQIRYSVSVNWFNLHFLLLYTNSKWLVSNSNTKSANFKKLRLNLQKHKPIRNNIFRGHTFERYKRISTKNVIIIRYFHGGLYYVHRRHFFFKVILFTLGNIVLWPSKEVQIILITIKNDILDHDLDHKNGFTYKILIRIIFFSWFTHFYEILTMNKDTKILIFSNVVNCDREQLIRN